MELYNLVCNDRIMGMISIVFAVAGLVLAMLMLNGWDNNQDNDLSH